jgi:hypothetical protein
MPKNKQKLLNKNISFTDRFAMSLTSEILPCDGTLPSPKPKGDGPMAKSTPIGKFFSNFLPKTETKKGKPARRPFPGTRFHRLCRPARLPE